VTAMFQPKNRSDVIRLFFAYVLLFPDESEKHVRKALANGLM